MAFRHVIADSDGKLRRNLGKSIVTPSTEIVVPSPSIFRKGLGQSSPVESIQYIETPQITKLRWGLGQNLQPPIYYWGIPEPEGQLWTPSLLPPYFWFDAANTSTLLLDSTNVSGWYNLASSNPLTQSGSARPTYNATGLNSLGTISFNGSSQFLTSEIASGANLNIFFVARNTRATIATPIIDNILSFNTFPASPNNQGIAVNTSNSFGGTQRALLLEASGSGSTQTRMKNGLTTPVTLALNEWFIGSAQYSSVPNQTGRILQIGRLNVNNTVFFFGQNEIAEIIGYSSAISDSNREKIEGYLAHKWNLASGLSVSHPYKSAPPFI